MEQQLFLEELDELYNAGDLKKTGEYIEKHRSLAREEQEGAFLVMVLNEAMNYYRTIGEYKEAIGAYDEAMNTLDRLGIREGQTLATTMLSGAVVYLSGGMYEAAIPMFHRTEAMFGKSDLTDTYEAASLYNSMALLYERTNEPEQVEVYLKKALEILRTIPECTQEEMSGRCKLTMLYLDSGREEEGRKQLDWVKDLYRQCRSEEVLPGMLGALGAVCYRAKDYASSVDFYTKAIDRTEELYGRNDTWNALMENALYVCEEAKDTVHAEILGIRAGKIRLPGMELSRRYYEECVKPVLKENCAEYFDKMTIGLAGYGAESLEYESTNPDGLCAPGIMIWMDRKDARKYRNQLEAELVKLPRTYLGIPMAVSDIEGTSGQGVISAESFYKTWIGLEREPSTDKEWEVIPESNLSIACGGRIFKEGSGLFMYVRRILQNYYSDEIRTGKLRKVMAQMDEWLDVTYERRYENADAYGSFLACAHFMDYAAKALYLLNQIYLKPENWQRRGMDKMALAADVPQYLDELARLPEDARKTHMNAIRVRLHEEMRAQGLEE